MSNKFPVNDFCRILYDKGYRIDIKRAGGVGAIMMASGKAGATLTITDYYEVVFINAYSAFGHTTKTFHREDFDQFPKYLQDNF